jgi:defect-in-organelle-trafficking protein DotB
MVVFASSDTIYTGHIRSSDDLRAFMNHAIRMNASDVFMQAGLKIYGEVYGDLVPLTRYKLQVDQVADILRLVTGNDDAWSALKGGRDYDTAFSIPDEVEKNDFGVPKNHRFRLNATGAYQIGPSGAQLVMRHIPSEPPRLEDIDFPEHLIPEIAVAQGGFWLAGTTGSGKTTTFAGCTRHVMENDTPIHGNIVTYEKPVEFLFNGIESNNCIIAQCEIGLHLPTFEDGVRNAMRRKPGLAIIGELRDQETIQAAVEFANTGHPIWSTVHAANSALIIPRMVQRYPTYAQHQAFTDIVQNTRFMMSQALVKRADKQGRVCLRDYVLLTPDRQEELISVGYERSAPLIRQWMREGDRGRDMLTSIGDEWVAGRISDQTREEAIKRFGG